MRVRWDVVTEAQIVPPTGSPANTFGRRKGTVERKVSREIVESHDGRIGFSNQPRVRLLFRCELRAV